MIAVHPRERIDGSATGKVRGLGTDSSRKEEIQPSKKELRDFYREAEQRLEYPVLWFDEGARIAIASAFEAVCKQHGYIAWACAVLQNHAHLLLRTHRDKARRAMRCGMQSWFRAGTRFGRIDHS